MIFGPVCVGYVTYNPDVKLLQRSLSTIIDQVDYVLIVDNGSDNKSNLASLCHNSNKTNIIYNCSNKGVATALNQIGKYAENLGCPWFLTLDQDSVCPIDLMSIYSKYMLNQDIGIISPFILQRNNSNIKSSTSQVCEFVEIVITSGCLVSTQAWKSVGGFWEDLFIDRVDDDFCLALRDHGWRILQTNQVCLEHQIGNPSLHSLFGKKYYTDSYPSFRYYYIARNTVIVCNYYNNLPYNMYKLLLKRFFKIIFGENNKYDKMQAFLSGLRDGRAKVRKGLERNTQ